MTDHEELESSVAALVLGAADPDELAAIRAHLEGCAGCRELAARLQRATDFLALATPTVEPPARLKSRILAAAAASPRPAAERPGARILPIPRRRTGGPRPSPAWWPGTAASRAVAALVVVVLGLGAWNVHLLTELGSQHAAQRVASVTISGKGQFSGSQANVLDFRDQSIALVSFSRLPAAPPGKVYELWLIPAGGAPEAVTVFQPDADGSKTIVVNRDLRRYKVIAVTAEDGPAGVAAPTQSPNLAGSIA